jgi:hypothetical protein
MCFKRNMGRNARRIYNVLSHLYLTETRELEGIREQLLNTVENSPTCGSISCDFKTLHYVLCN